MIIVQGRRRTTQYLIPAGGEILWYGIAANVPATFTIDSYASGVFIRGADAGGATDTPVGSATHSHTNPAATGTQAAHTHPIGGGNTQGSSGTEEVFNTSPQDLAPAHSHSVGTGTSGSGGGHSHTLSNVVSQEVYPPYAKLYWIRATVDSPLPVNGILMLDANIANRPVGTELCDGTNGTLDLRDNFIFGASTDGDLGATGGSETHVHGNVDAGAAGSHSHSLSVSCGPATSQGDASGFAGIEVAAGGHTHSLTSTSNTDANHTHTLSDTGSGTNTPPHMLLYFVMRTV